MRPLVRVLAAARVSKPRLILHHTCTCIEHGAVVASVACLRMCRFPLFSNSYPTAVLFVPVSRVLVVALGYLSTV